MFLASIALGFVIVAAQVPSQDASALVHRNLAVDAPLVTLPEPTGHHLVGTASWHWIHEHPETQSPDPTARRQVIAQVWYPAEPMAKPVYADYVPALPAMRGALRTSSEALPQRIAEDLGVLAGVQTQSLVGARVDEQRRQTRYPVVIFSPGGNMSRHYHTALMQDLASHGYVSVAISHAYSGWDVFPAGGFIKSVDWGLDADDPALARANEDAMADILAEDVRLVRARLTELNQASGGILAGRLDFDHWAMIGHSRGGTTASRVCSTQQSVDACVILDNIGAEREIESGLGIPQLALRRADWLETRIDSLRGFLSRNARESWDIAVAGATHFTLSDLPIADPAHYESKIDPRRGHRVVSRLVRTFLDRHVRGDETMDLATAAAQLTEVNATQVVGDPHRIARQPGTGFAVADGADPTALDWSEAALVAADRIAEEIGTTTWLAVDQGRLVWSFGVTDQPLRAHSLRKSLLDAVAAVSVASGQIGLETTLGALEVNDYIPLSPTEARARFGDLLESCSGVYRQAAYENAGWDTVRPAREKHPPGTHFFYSNWDFNLAGLVVSRSTGRNLFEMFDTEVARPMGLQDHVPSHGGWRYDLDRSAHPAFVFRISARDLATFGLHYLRAVQGVPDVIPADWARSSTRPRSEVIHPRTGETIDGTAYGRLWWTATEQGGGPSDVELGPGAFWASGTGGQLLAISPVLDLVLVHLADTELGTDPVDDDEIGRWLQAVLRGQR